MFRRLSITFASVAFCLMGSLHAQEKYVIESMPFNTPRFREYSPTIIDKRLVFSSDRKSDLFLSHTVDSNLANLTNLFEVDLDDPANVGLSKFTKRKKIPYHIAAGYYDPDSKNFFLTRNIGGKKRGHDRKVVNTLGIYYIETDDPEATELVPYEWNSKKYSSAHPMARMMDGYLTMVYSSNMDSGMGMSDLYMSQHVAGRWTKPKNLGKHINSSSRDVFPYLDKKFNLYFSSNRPGGNGGLDLYVASWNGTNWGVPVHLDSTMNSSQDDFGLIKTGPESGYFSSNRAGSDDVYSFRVGYPEFEFCDSIQKVYLCYDFFEEASVGIDTLPMIYEWDFGDGTKVRAIETEHCYPGPGNYTIQLNIIDTVINEVFMNEATYELDIEDIQQPYITSADSVKRGSSLKLSAKDTKWKAFEIKEYYWDFGSGVVKRGMEVEHTWDTPGYQTVTLGIVSEQDTNGLFQKACTYKGIYIVDSAWIAQQEIANLLLRVLNKANEPIVGQRVQVIKDEQVVDTLLTNDRGEVEIDSTTVEDGAYLKLDAEEVGLQMLVVEGDDVIHKLEKDDKGFDLDPDQIQLKRRKGVKGRGILITDGNGKPQANKTLVVRSNKGVVDTLVSDADGYVVFKDEYRMKTHWLALDPDEEGLKLAVVENEEVLYNLERKNKEYQVEPGMFKAVDPRSATLRNKNIPDSLLMVKIDKDSVIVKKVYRVELLRSATALENRSQFDFLLYPVTEHTSNDSSEFIYTIGEATSPLDLRKQYRNAIEGGFKAAKVSAFENDPERKLASNKVETKGSVAPYEANKIFQFQDIYFNSGRSEVLSAGKRELDKLIRIMKNYRNLDVNIMAHADSSGSSAANLVLTRKRANSVKSYIVSKGVSSTRIRATGFGDTKPIVSNATPKGRAQNRRVEFKFIEQ